MGDQAALVGRAVAALALAACITVPAPALAQDPAEDEAAADTETEESFLDEDFSVPVPDTVVQPRLVTATDPDTVRDALLSAGYPAVMDTDTYGDPMIRTEFGGYKGSVIFYDCDPDLHTGCQAVQFSVGLDRRDAMPPDMALKLMSERRFMSIQLDSEGDPFLQWDIVTGDGIATSIFLQSLASYSSNVAGAAAEVFAEESETELDLSMPPEDQPFSWVPHIPWQPASKARA